MHPLPSQFTLETLEPLIGELKRDFACPMALDASRIDTVTTPALQLLLSLQKTCAEKGGRLTLAAPSRALTQALALTGLESLTMEAAHA